MTAQPKGRLQSAGAVVPLAVLATFPVSYTHLTLPTT